MEKMITHGTELTKLLREMYDQGVADATVAALEATEKVVAAAVQAEREACARVCDDIGNTYALDCAAAIRARQGNHD